MKAHLRLVVYQCFPSDTALIIFFNGHAVLGRLWTLVLGNYQCFFQLHFSHGQNKNIPSRNPSRWGVMMESSVVSAFQRSLHSIKHTTMEVTSCLLFHVIIMPSSSRFALNRSSVVWLTPFLKIAPIYDHYVCVSICVSVSIFLFVSVWVNVSLCVSVCLQDGTQAFTCVRHWIGKTISRCDTGKDHQQIWHWARPSVDVTLEKPISRYDTGKTWLQPADFWIRRRGGELCNTVPFNYHLGIQVKGKK